MNAALAWQLHQEECIAGAVQREEDPESLCATRALAVADEKCIGMDVVMLEIVEDELPISERIKKRRWISVNCLCYMDPPEVEKEEAP